MAGAFPAGFYLPGKENHMKEKHGVVLTSVEQLNEYLKENADGRTVISIILELAGEKMGEGGGENG